MSHQALNRGKKKDPLSIADSGPSQRARRVTIPQPPDRQSASDASASLQIKAFRPSVEPACTAACTGSTENVSAKPAEEAGRKARKAKLKTAATTTAIPADDGNRRQPTTDFAQQVAGIMALPLTDAEKTDCIRRLLAAQPLKGC